MKMTSKKYILCTLVALFILTSSPNGGHACPCPTKAIITAAATLLFVVPTVVAFAPSRLSQHQYCDYGTSSSCCDSAATPGPTLPSNCTVLQTTTAVCPEGKALFCDGANVAAPWVYQPWAVPVGSISTAVIYVGSIATTALISAWK